MVVDDDDDEGLDEEFEALEDDDTEEYDDEPAEEVGDEESPEDDGMAEAEPDKLRALLQASENRAAARQRIIDRELREAREQRVRIERILAEKEKPAPEPEDEIPDPEEDLTGFIAKSFERLGKRVDTFENRIKEGEQRAKEDKELLEAFDRGEQEIAEFREATPDYREVVGNTASALIVALIDRGMSEQEASDTVANRILELRFEAAQKGLNPGAYLYANALSARKALNMGPRRAAAPPPKPERPDPVRDRVRRERDRQRGSRSLAAMGGRGPRGGDLGKVDLARLDQGSYDRIVEQRTGGDRSQEATVLRDLLWSKAKNFTPRRSGRR